MEKNIGRSFHKFDSTIIILMKNRVLIAVYSHPEFYPPTLNLIGSLANSYDNVLVLSRNVFDSDWDYPQNTRLFTSGKKMGMRETEAQSLLLKVWSFLQFTARLLVLCVTYRPQVVQVCDSIPLMSYLLIKPFFFKKTLLWYHNHDVVDYTYIRKYSISWFSGKFEQAYFGKIDIFSLPANDRRQYFSMDSLKGKYIYLPNFPSVGFYEQFYQPKTITDEIRIVYQGQIGKGHGFEEIISIMNTPIRGARLSLHLKGTITEQYKNELVALASDYGVMARLYFYGVTSYREVPRLASTCHIGIGIHSKQDIMNKTLGTASNKIYEYAALGLPVLLFDSSHFRTHLERYDWAVFTDLTTESLTTAIGSVVENYDHWSSKAHEDFKDGLNYEFYFNEVKPYLV